MISDERLEQLRRNYTNLALSSERKERGYSDLEHAELLAELQSFRRGFDDEGVTAERRQIALRTLQLMAGDLLGQLTSNHPWYRIFETMHRIAAQAQLASMKVTNLEKGAKS